MKLALACLGLLLALPVAAQPILIPLGGAQRPADPPPPPSPVPVAPPQAGPSTAAPPAVPADAEQATDEKPPAPQ